MQAVLFDVDFTLIYPGPMFGAEGYDAFCKRYGIEIDPSRFESAVASAGPILDEPDDPAYDAEVFVRYTRHIIEQMGGTGARLDDCAREIYDEWAGCHHFYLYDEVPSVLRQLAAAKVRIGLISNSHRSLASFESHFELDGLIAGAVSSSEHGFMKPHPSIFRAALALIDAEPAEALMVGDSLRQDVEGAKAVGMSAALLHRRREAHPREAELQRMGIPVIRSLRDVLLLTNSR